MIKSISFYTLGCRLNQAEEERLRREFMEAGFFVMEPEKAGICIVNTCSVTNLADVKSHRAIKHLKKINPKLKIVAIGCGADEKKAYPEVDLWINNDQKPQLLEIISSNFKVLKQPTNRNTLAGQAKLETQKLFSGRTRALLKIQDGCNNFCAYCIVPYLRGREVSVPAKDVLSEAKKLEEMGYKELVLSGVNVGKYGADQIHNSKTDSKIEKQNSKLKANGLTELLELLLKETNFPRIRLSSVNPQDITDEMIDLWAKEPRLCRHFHLSLQSGSTTVLRRMGRPYTAQFYYSLTKKIVQKLPEVAITTDVIVGFPGETESEFKETLSFVKKIKFAKLHVFRYSKRSGTRAENMPNQVPESIKTKRSKTLHRCSDVLEREFKERFIGQEMEVLFEEKKGEYWYGLSSNYIRIKYFSNKNLENKLVKIRIGKNNLV